MSVRILVALLCAAFAPFSATAGEAGAPLFSKSYAIVVGIDVYPHQRWARLNYAVKDAQGVAEFLRTQGFEVTELYEKRATKQAIVSEIEDRLAAKLTAQDRVLFFFAGHGATRTLGDEQRGYLVAYDGTDSFASLLPMSHVRDLSSAMAMAKHQLFILDACFGGLLAMRGSTVDPRTPNYVDEITKRRARQVLTAGGANQRVVDSGPGGHSLFTGQLLKALTGGLGDANGDGYITFSELSSYIQVAASQYNQTPGVSELYGHEQGDFVFVNTARKTPSPGGTDSQAVSPGAFRAPEKDVYELLKVGKQSFARGDYASARTAFREAAEIGNAEAMVFLGKMYWSGLGETADHGKAREWLQRAADRGDARAMASLANLYLHPGPYQNPTEAQRWKVATAEAEKLEQAIVLSDPTGGRADRGEPKIPARDIVVPPPRPPTGFRIQ